MKKTISYNPVKVEPKWSRIWEDNKAFKVDIKGSQRPFYNLMMFPYPSGEGLHIGHTYSFGGADTYGRFKRMQGYDVFEPMGFDAFGIHSENYALKKNTHPKQLINETINFFRDKQLKRFGAIFDWDNSISTTEPAYYAGTQWLFVKLFKAGLAVRKQAKVDWCPACLTVLAAEQVIQGECERCGSRVVQKELEQWFFKITNYADRLLENLSVIDWSETTKQMQKNWIGKSEGAEVVFGTDARVDISVYTTRLDTIFGVTFLAISPEYSVLYKNSKIDIDNLNLDFITGDLDEVRHYLKNSQQKNDQTKQAEKTGVFTGRYAINPLTSQKVPIYICDYVLSGYGSGAVMGVPAHDARDLEFAHLYGLDIVSTVSPEAYDKKTEREKEGKPKRNQRELFVDYGYLVNSGKYDGLTSLEAQKAILKDLIRQNQATAKTNYHLRDWLISRQRYWGPPIPMVYCQKCAANNISWFETKEAEQFQQSIKKPLSGNDKDLNIKFLIGDFERMPGWFPVPEDQLPILLPDIENFKPTGSGQSPLEQDDSFMETVCPNCSSEARREKDVSDTFLDSSWYFLKYPSVELEARESLDNSDMPWDRQVTEKWLPVDMYIGGNEHAVLHLLYTRFITMALHDLAYLKFEEPFKKFRAHGLITYNGMKMSKSRGNVINPNDYFDSYGFDTIKLYLLFIGPYEEGGDWNDRGIMGCYRFIQRLWGLVSGDYEGKVLIDPKRKNRQAKIIKSVTEDLEHLKFNTAIAKLMAYLNYLLSLKISSRQEIETLVLLLAPLAPFVTEESWFHLKGLSEFKVASSVHNQPWPVFSEGDISQDTVTVVIQVNGKFLNRLDLNYDLALDEDKVTTIATADPKIKAKTQGYQKVIYVRGKVLNFVL